MRPPVEIQDRGDYKARMRELLEVDPRRTVALTIDMQGDYLDPEVGTAPLPPDEIERVVGNTAKLLDVCRSSGIPVIHCYVARRPVEAERGFYSTPYGRASHEARLSQNAIKEARPGIDRIAGSPTVDLPPALVAEGDVHMTTKRAQDSFHLTDLDMLLTRVFHPDTLIIAGINTDTCVHATTFGASNRGYRPVVVADCVGSMRGADHHWMALELMARTMAWVLTSEELFEKLSGTTLPS